MSIFSFLRVPLIAAFAAVLSTTVASSETLLPHCANIEGEQKCGYLSVGMQWAIPPQYDYVYSFTEEGFAVVKDGEAFMLIDEDNRHILQEWESKYVFVVDGLYASQTNGRWGIRQLDGEWVVDPQFQSIEYSNSLQSGIPAQQRNLWGTIDLSGNWLIKPSYSAKYFFFGSGLAAVERNGRYGFIDATEALVIPYSFDATYGFSDVGFAFASANGLAGIIDIKGEWVINPQYERAAVLSHNRFAVKSQGLWGILDERQQWIIAPSWDNMITWEGSDFIPVEDEGYWGMVSSEGELLIPPIFSRIQQHSGFFRVALSGDFHRGAIEGYLNPEGKSVSFGHSYEEISDFTAREVQGSVWTKFGDRTHSNLTFRNRISVSRASSYSPSKPCQQGLICVAEVRVNDEITFEFEIEGDEITFSGGFNGRQLCEFEFGGFWVKMENCSSQDWDGVYFLSSYDP